ncbi:MAG: glycosyltransferase family 2 protein [Thermodesulfobacteriota bacterium]
MFFNFNGTAGVIRKECIESSGGWQHDTLTEDLDLSYRAQLAGWKLVYAAT